MADNPVINLSFGTPPGMTAEAFLYTHLTLSAFIGCVALYMTSTFLRLSNIPISFLWALYFVVGLVFHVCSLLSGDVQSYAFLGLTALHLFVELMLCIKVLVNKPEQVNYYAKTFSCYYLCVTFLCLLLWQPLNLFALGSFLALPADILVFPAAFAVMKRAKNSAVWYFGLVWSLNTPLVCVYFAIAVWGAKTTDSHTAAAHLLLQIQYIVMGLLLIVNFRSLDPNRIGTETEADDCMELGLLSTSRHGSAGERQSLLKSSPSPDPMKAAFRTTLLIMGVEVLASVVVPLLIGKIDLNMMLFNTCNVFKPGNVQVLGNTGPNFIVPVVCSG